MLGEMLRLLGRGGIRSTAELARELHVSEDLARLMVEDLTRRGYLAALQTDCASGCAGCALADACARPSGTAAFPVLALTTKGREAITDGAR